MQTREITTKTLAAQPTAVRRAILAPNELAGWFPVTYGAIAAYLERAGATVTGLPFSRYHVRADGRFGVDAGFPVREPIEGDGTTEASELPAGPVVVTTHIGSYDDIGVAHELLEAWIASHAGVPAGDPWEIYEPPEGDPSGWHTEVVQPYRTA